MATSVDDPWVHAAARPLDSAGTDALRAYEEACTALGRLDGTVALAPPIVTGFLQARHAAVASGRARSALCAVLGSAAGAALAVDPLDAPAVRYATALRAISALARDGRPPGLPWLTDLVRKTAGAAATEAVPGATLAALLGTGRDRTPPVLKAAVFSGALAMLQPFGIHTTTASLLATSALLSIGGTLSDPFVAIGTSASRVDADAALAALSRDARWDAWMAVWCRAAAREARDLERSVRDAVSRFDDDAAQVAAMRRVSASVGAVLGQLLRAGVTTIPAAAKALDLTRPTVGAALDRLEQMGLAVELTGRGRDRAWAYASALDAMTPAGR